MSFVARAYQGIGARNFAIFHGEDVHEYSNAVYIPQGKAVPVASGMTRQQAAMKAATLNKKYLPTIETQEQAAHHLKDHERLMQCLDNAVTA